MVSETGIEPLKVEIGQKLVSVDQKTSTTMMVMEYPTFVTQDSTDLISSRYMVILSKIQSILTF